MSPELHSILSELRKTLENLYGSRLSNIVLFGSQARGAAVSGSDIDVLIVLDGPLNPGVFDEPAGGALPGVAFAALATTFRLLALLAVSAGLPSSME